MCYTGICPYENCTGSSDHIGECTLTCKLEDYPEDAECKGGVDDDIQNTKS